MMNILKLTEGLGLNWN